MRCRTLAMTLSMLSLLVLSAAHAEGDKEKKQPEKTEKKAVGGHYLLVVPPVGGKEIKLIDYRFTQGTRPFALTAPADPKSKQPAGPDHLEFREEKSTTYKNGIFTLVPLSAIKKITYDRDKKTVAVAVATSEPDEVVLNGLTKFAGTNKITIEAETILDGLGAATVKFQGGIDKGLHSVAFPFPKAVEKASGAPATVTADDKEKSKHVAHGVQPLYLVDGQYRVMPYLMFKKTVKVDMDKIASLRFMPPADKKSPPTDYEVTLKDGAKHILTLLKTVEVDSKKSMTFVGLVGRVPVGYKLFSLDAIYAYDAEELRAK